MKLFERIGYYDPQYGDDVKRIARQIAHQNLFSYQTNKLIPIKRFTDTSNFLNTYCTEDLKTYDMFMASRYAISSPKEFYLNDPRNIDACGRIDINLNGEDYHQPYPTCCLKNNVQYVFDEIVFSLNEMHIHHDTDKSVVVFSGIVDFPEYINAPPPPGVEYPVLFIRGILPLQKNVTIQQSINNWNLQRRSEIKNKDQYYKDHRNQEDFEKMEMFFLKLSMNAMIMLTMFGFDKIKTKYNRSKTKKQNNKEEIIKYQLNQKILLFDRETPNTNETSENPEKTIKSISCHWRRGHYRNQVCGERNSQRKIIFIKPVLVKKDLYVGENFDANATYKVIYDPSQ